VVERKTIIVTGASRGLGAATARILGDLGADVVLNARSAEQLQRVADEIRENGGNAIAVPGDVSQREDCERLVNQAFDYSGRIDGLVNNAAIIDPVAPLAEVDPGEWERHLAINLLGPLMLIQSALPYLREREGRVINVSSGAATSAIAGWSAYCAGKAALNRLTAVLAVEEPSIIAIAVRPGIVDTEMQNAIRTLGATGMTAAEHKRFVAYKEEGQLQPPEVPGRALAVLALHAPRDWSGEFLSWDEPRVQRLRQGRQ
jgi:NAD(P)-dependent dehydrogenase (short-subunit alcohol dehydrogenase family)